MSIVGARVAIVDALNTVDGVKAYMSKPTTPRAGDAWCRWNAEVDDQVGAFNVVWSIGIVTPQDERAADAWIDNRIELLLTALRPVTYVTAYAVANLANDASPVYGLLITTNRE